MDWFVALLLIGLAGGVGSVIRALLSKLDGWLPFGLFLTNTLAASLIAWLVAGGELPSNYLEIASVGFAGGLSTFSTAMKAGFDFYHRGRLMQAILTTVGNVALPLVGVMLAAGLR